MWRRVWIWSVLLVHLLQSATAQAGSRSSRELRALAPSVQASPASSTANSIGLLMVPLMVVGDVPATLVERFRAIIEQQAALSTVALTQPQQAITCNDVSCYIEQAKRRDLPLVLVPRLEVEERSYRVGLELYESLSHRILATSSERCELCGLAEVEELIATRTAVIRDKIEDYTLRSATLSITSEPAAAWVQIDGEKIGKTPLQTMVVPGEHMVVIVFDQEVTQTRSVRSVRGVREILHFEGRAFVPPTATTTRMAPMINLQGWGWLAVGTGAVASIAGGVLLGLNHRPYRRDCDGANVDANGTCRFRYATSPAGIASLSVGAVLVATGVALIWIGHRRKKQAGR